MKRLKRLSFLAVVALLAFPWASAQAGWRLSFGVGIGFPPCCYRPCYRVIYPAPSVYLAPAPVYVQPAPVYVQPAPVYVQPAPGYVQPVYVVPAPGYGQQQQPPPPPAPQPAR